MNNGAHSDTRRDASSTARDGVCPVAAMTPAEVAALFGRAVALHQAGRLSEAEPHYREVLRAEPRHFDSMHLLGVIHCQRGELQQAVNQLDAALNINPTAAAAHNNRGNALKALGRAQEAIESYGRAIELKPNYAEAFYNRGSVLQGLTRFADAIADYDRATALKPDFAEAFNNRGNALKGLNRYEEALASYDRAIAANGRYAEAWYNRSNALKQLRRFDEALASCDMAVALNPDLAEAFYNRGGLLRDLRRFDEAVESYQRAVALSPTNADAFNSLGNVLRELRRFDEALTNYDRAIALSPIVADAFCRRGIALAELQRNEEALASYDRAIALDPRHAEAFYSRSIALLTLRRVKEAIVSLSEAIALAPNETHLKGMRLHAKMLICDWTNFDAESAELNAAAADGTLVTCPFQLLACDSAPASQFNCARNYAADKWPASAQPIWRGERYAHERIRVAYLSADFRDHPVSFLTAGLFARHDRARFETVAMSFGPDEPSPTRERLRASFEHFLDVDAKSDREIAELMRSLEIDIAVDLHGYTDGARPSIFAQRPAPIQVSYLGYAGTLGQDYCDYIIADRFVIPEETRRDFAENVVYLPDSFMVNDADRKICDRVPSRADAGLPETGFVFCCFNNAFKITPDLFDVWMRLLKAIEGSVLWLSTANSTAVDNLRREAGRRGVAADRLIFAPRVPLNEDHLARLRLADLFLDTLHYNAHTTSADALWAGVPVLTCSGATFASRVAGSMLHAIGLPELVTTSVSDYEALALVLARDPTQLASLRGRLARNRDIYPLFDTARFTRHIEAAFTVMWERAQRGAPPQSFTVPGAG